MEKLNAIQILRHSHIRKSRVRAFAGDFFLVRERYILIMTDAPQNRITIDPAICNGKPTIRGLRITVQTVLEYLGAGESREEILQQFPMLEPEDINACLASGRPAPMREKPA